MIKRILPFVFGSLMASASAQVIKLDVEGIDITSSKAQVLRKLGKATTTRVGGVVPCSDGSTLTTLRYPGLTLSLESSRDSKDFGVYEIAVTSSRWSLAGIRIGTRRSNVVAKFGKGRDLEENGRRFLAYYIKDGYASFYFTKNRLVKVFWEFNFC